MHYEWRAALGWPRRQLPRLHANSLEQVTEATKINTALISKRLDSCGLTRDDAEQQMNTMTLELPPAIAAFFQAHNSGHTANFSELFTDDALVSDESHEYQGAGIKEWIDGAVSKYQPVAAVTDLAEAGVQTIATAQVSGNFPGSPTQLRYNFTLKNGKIAVLAIGA